MHYVNTYTHTIVITLMYTIIRVSKSIRFSAIQTDDKDRRQRMILNTSSQRLSNKRNDYRPPLSKIDAVTAACDRYTHTRARTHTHTHTYTYAYTYTYTDTQTDQAAVLPHRLLLLWQRAGHGVHVVSMSFI